MVFTRILALGFMVFLSLLGWSWLRSQQSAWARQNRSYFGWALGIFVLSCLFILLRLLLPKI